MVQEIYRSKVVDFAVYRVRTKCQFGSPIALNIRNIESFMKNKINQSEISDRIGVYKLFQHDLKIHILRSCGRYTEQLPGWNLFGCDRLDHTDCSYELAQKTLNFFCTDEILMLKHPWNPLNIIAIWLGQVQGSTQLIPHNAERHTSQRAVVKNSTLMFTYNFI